MTCPAPSPPPPEATTDTRRRILTESCSAIEATRAEKTSSRRAITREHASSPPGKAASSPPGATASAPPKASSPPGKTSSPPARRPSIRVDQVGARAGSYAISARQTGRVPRLAKGKKDVASAPIDPKAAFVLSQIDGTLSIDDLADLTGLAPEDVVGICERMVRLGLVLL